MVGPVGLSSDLYPFLVSYSGISAAKSCHKTDLNSLFLGGFFFLFFFTFFKLLQALNITSSTLVLANCLEHWQLLVHLSLAVLERTYVLDRVFFLSIGHCDDAPRDLAPNACWKNSVPFLFLCHNEIQHIFSKIPQDERQKAVPC